MNRASDSGASFSSIHASSKILSPGRRLECLVERAAGILLELFLQVWVRLKELPEFPAVLKKILVSGARRVVLQFLRDPLMVIHEELQSLVVRGMCARSRLVGRKLLHPLHNAIGIGADLRLHIGVRVQEFRQFVGAVQKTFVVGE